MATTTSYAHSASVLTTVATGSYTVANNNQLNLWSNFASAPIMTVANPSDRTITINGPNGKEIVSIRNDGTVKVSEFGSDIEASQRFYKAMEVVGVNLYSKIKALEATVENLKAEKNLATVALTNIKDAITPDDDHPTALKIRQIAEDTIQDIK